MKSICKVLILGIILASISMLIGYKVGNSIDVSYLYQQNIKN